MTKENTYNFFKTAAKNLWSFGKIMALILLSIALFGEENTLPAVCIAVAWLMFPESNLNLKPWVFTINTFFLFIFGAISGQAIHLNILGAGFIWFATTIVILLLSMAPLLYQPSIPFLLNFVFCQAVPSTPGHFADRIICLAVGSAFLCIVTLVSWKKKGWSQGTSGFRQQIEEGLTQRSYILRMATGLAIAMIITTAMHMHKPLWISIVVMSLTELEAEMMHLKIKNRLLGTAIGIIFFTIIIGILLPPSLAPAFILLMGYVGFFFSDYRTKSIFNAISALNASLVIFDHDTAIADRIGCLFIGMAIVLTLYGLSKLRHHIVRKNNI